MHAISQIIERNLHRREACESACWLNPENDDCWSIVAEKCQTLSLYSQDFGVFLSLQQNGASIEFVAFPEEATRKYDWVIVNLPRQKALLHMMLDYAADLLTEDGVLWLAGENKAGIKSAGKHLGLHFSHVEKLDNARHCTLYEASGVLQPGSFKSETYRNEWQIDCKETQLSVVSYPGVFAHGRLDAGTALLLTALAGMRIEGDVLDFACGAGVIGACIAASHPHANVTLLDSNALAIMSSEETLALNQLAGSTMASDGLSELEKSYDIVVTNPPIHAGLRTDSQLTIRLLESVYEHINPGGKLIMVANVHLPYERWLSQTFGRCKELLANENYKVIVAQK